MNVLRVIGHATTSILLGAMFGCVAGIAMGLTFELFAAAIVGGFVGLIFSPALVWALWVGNPIPVLAVIAGATSVTAAVCGRYVPQIAMFASVGSYIISCAVCGAWARNRAATLEQRRIGRCGRCGYSLAGLPGSAPCPECGFSDPYRLRPTSCRKCGGSLAMGPCCPECGTAN